MGQSETVLVIEDDTEIVDLLSLHLRDLGLEVDSAGNGQDGVAKAQAGGYALVLLDIMLPGLDGLEVCRRIREQPGYIPVLMLTARSEELDKVVGLEVGADDYVTKPFSVRELMARVRALLRRTERISRAASGADGVVEEQPQHFGRLTVDTGRRSVSLDGNRVELTAKEFDLLATLCRHPGQAFSRAKLLEIVWGYGYEGYSHTVNSHVNRLRSKIEVDPSRPQFIETVWGYGYRFVASGEAG
ncbi:MAG: response regulator transcription factor [Spirochaetia bacterium]